MAKSHKSRLCLTDYFEKHFDGEFSQSDLKEVRVFPSHNLKLRLQQKHRDGGRIVSGRTKVNGKYFVTVLWAKDDKPEVWEWKHLEALDSAGLERGDAVSRFDDLESGDGGKIVSDPKQIGQNREDIFVAVQWDEDDDEPSTITIERLDELRSL